MKTIKTFAPLLWILGFILALHITYEIGYKQGYNKAKIEQTDEDQDF